MLYTSFRSMITRESSNLPLSNGLGYYLLRHAGGANPYNDMQVRLSHQSLGGPVARQEVVLPAVEGHHWQWAFVEGELPASGLGGLFGGGEESLADDEPDGDRYPFHMLSAYYRTLHEIGLLVPPETGGASR